MFLLANEGISPTQWVLLGLILVLIILYPVFTIYKNKKEKEKFDNLAKDLKIGDKILTSSGTYGEIVEINERQYGKVLTIKTGDEKNFGYMAVDILTVYSVFREVEEVEAKTVEEPKVAEEPKAVEEVKAVEKPKAEKKAPAKKTTTSKNKAKK